MARISIYVSDELKARMDEARDALNWSDIARPAFEAALATYNHRKGQTMQTAIERLRASKVQHDQQQENDGKEAGREWAANRAEFAELKRLSEIDLRLFDGRVNDLWKATSKAVDPENTLTEEEYARYLFLDNADEELSDEYLAAFVEGAQEFFAEIEDKL